MCRLWRWLRLGYKDTTFNSREKEQLNCITSDQELLNSGVAFIEKNRYDERGVQRTQHQFRALINAQGNENIFQNHEQCFNQALEECEIRNISLIEGMCADEQKKIIKDILTTFMIYWHHYYLSIDHSMAKASAIAFCKKSAIYSPTLFEIIWPQIEAERVLHSAPPLLHLGVSEEERHLSLLREQIKNYLNIPEANRDIIKMCLKECMQCSNEKFEQLWGKKIPEEMIKRQIVHLCYSFDGWSHEARHAYHMQLIEQGYDPILVRDHFNHFQTLITGYQNLIIAHKGINQQSLLGSEPYCCHFLTQRATHSFNEETLAQLVKHSYPIKERREWLEQFHLRPHVPLDSQQRNFMANLMNLRVNELGGDYYSLIFQTERLLEVIVDFSHHASL